MVPKVLIVLRGAMMDQRHKQQVLQYQQQTNLTVLSIDEERRKKFYQESKFMVTWKCKRKATFDQERSRISAE